MLLRLLQVAALLAVSQVAQATAFTFDADPFAGTTALTTPGRQVIGGELFLNFNPENDTFVFDPAAFGVAGPASFINTPAGGIPGAGVNVVVLRTFDNDNNTLTPFGAGNAADLIAEQVTTAGAGFFVYFNQGLNLARLVFSTDLNSSTADLKILGRLLDFSGPAGQERMATLTAANFDIGGAANAVPEPTSLLLLSGALGALLLIMRRRHGGARMPSLARP